MGGAQRQPLPGRRWHLQHGPIDLVIVADGDPAAVAAAHEAAWQRFQGVLAELVAELPLLRQSVAVASACPLRGPVARRMWAACAPYATHFITPMAAVAGSVAQELIACYHRDGIQRAAVNNGGDIALHLAPGASFRIGMVADIASGIGARTTPGPMPLDGHLTVQAGDPVRGVATSGWRGRSLSRGIADSVTVLAATAAMADAAATMIANAVDVDDPRIVRRPAGEVRDDSDLGERLVTVDVPTLSSDAVRRALQAGADVARQFQARGWIVAAALHCQGQHRRVGDAASGVLAPSLLPSVDGLPRGPGPIGRTTRPSMTTLARRPGTSHESTTT
ncbi:UPF0280 family protein [Ideonella sp. A 288]|uniref:UPF0280 family protein n=1 Tax=Ideonella sp. A 288 TaxID=1962181 RepID=UPI000B4BAF34|nr:UPF0280 family protein [Ideonella sp. A 288]